MPLALGLLCHAVLQGFCLLAKLESITVQGSRYDPPGRRLVQPRPLLYRPPSLQGLSSNRL